MRIPSLFVMLFVAATAAAQTPAPAPEPAPAPPSAPAPSSPPAAPLSPQPVPSDVAAPPADAVKSQSGLAWKVLKPGSGSARPTRDDMVTVHYSGWTPDGKLFDSSVARGAPATFHLDHVIPGWTEGLQLMVAGETRRFWVPARLAYRGRPGPKSMVVFDIELIAFADSPTKAPPDVKGPPPGAKKTRTGLYYLTLKPGTGERRPDRKSQVVVHYTGWTTDGKSFDSSVLRGKPETLALKDVIPGWIEGLQLMVEGEKMRFWIPEFLAYAGRNEPYGMLVFDIELIGIK